MGNSRKDGRVVECAGLEIRYTVIPYRGFKSHSFRQSLLWHRRNSKAAPVAIKKAIKTGKKRAPNSDDCSGLLVLNPTREFYSIALLSFKSFWHLLV